MTKDDLNFLGLLSAHRRGELVREMDDLLQELIAALDEFGGSGELTLKLKVKRNDAEQLEINPKADLKKPRRTLGMGIFYTNEGKLSRRDSKQDDFLDDLDDARERRIRADIDG